MKSYQEFFTQNPNGTMATVDNGTPKTRIFQALWTEGDKVYFCTSNQKPVFAQMKANPQASFCAWNAGTFETAAVSGKVVFVDDAAAKARALDENPSIKSIYNEPSNPVFELLYIDVAEVETFSFAEGPKKYKIQ